jgi:hypothetical protein
MKIAEVYDFQEWLQLNNIKNHSHPHVFKFTKNEDGKATMKYKKWSTDKVMVLHHFQAKPGNSECNTCFVDIDNFFS